MNHPPLKAPLVDVYDLTNLLRQLDFKVVSLLDLTEAEMRNAVGEFLQLLHKGVYGMDVWIYCVYVWTLTLNRSRWSGCWTPSPKVLGSNPDASVYL